MLLYASPLFHIYYAVYVQMQNELRKKNYYL